MDPLMSRGDRCEDIFLDDADRHDFIKTLAEACLKTGWPVRAYCLMRDHYHLVLATPAANLVAGRALATRRQSDPGKPRIAARLRRETTLTIKAIASRVRLGSSRSGYVRLHEWIKSPEATAQAD